MISRAWSSSTAAAVPRRSRRSRRGRRSKSWAQDRRGCRSAASPLRTRGSSTPPAPSGRSSTPTPRRSGRRSRPCRPTSSLPVPVTNLAQYGYALDSETSPAGLRAAQAHLGRLAASGEPRGWDQAGELTPIGRYARMFAGWRLKSLDGTAWYHPRRLTIDAGAVAAGNANPAQDVLGVRATHGDDLPRKLRIYAFGAALGGQRVLDAARALATQSGIPGQATDPGGPQPGLLAQRPQLGQSPKRVPVKARALPAHGPQGLIPHPAGPSRAGRSAGRCRRRRRPPRAARRAGPRRALRAWGPGGSRQGP